VTAMEALDERGVMIYNLSTGQGHSVREVIETVQSVTGRKVQVEEGPRRPGDPPALVGSPAKVRAELGWQPRYASLEEIVRHAWAWHEKHPDGYGKG
jgi:UDP-glucose 4-epimerase